MKLPFGLQDGKIVDISEVPSGASCNCICPECGTPLIAKKGKVVQHHFSHSSDKNDCKGALETSIHMMAKEILAKSNGFLAPSLGVRLDAYALNGKQFIADSLVCDLARIQIDAPNLERTWGEFRPDILGKLNGRDFAIEILVTHQTTSRKKTSFRDSEIYALEIDLSDEIRVISKTELEAILINRTSNKAWLSHAQYRATEASLKTSLQKQVEAENATYKELLNGKKNLEADPSPNGNRPLKNHPNISPKQPNVIRQRTHTWVTCGNPNCRTRLRVPNEYADSDTSCPICYDNPDAYKWVQGSYIS
jgi:hypothetical protein